MSHCDDALRRISRALIDYRKAHDDRYPPTLETLVENESLSPWDLVCPVSTFGVGECSYEYCGADLDGWADPELILAYDRQPHHKGRRNILFVDGRVERLPENVFQSLLKKDDRLRRQYLGTTNEPD